MPTVMSLRPLTFGELLDAAVLLLRTYWRVLLCCALVLAALEQAVLYPVRRLAGMSSPGYLPFVDRLGWFWLAIAVGLGTEAAIVAVLGVLSGTAAGPALLGQRLSGRELLRRSGRRAGAALVIGLVAALLAGLGGLAALLPWIFMYGLIGLAGPAAVTDRIGPFPALGRSFVLSCRTVLRAVWLRVGAYLSWLTIRLAVGFGGSYGLRLVLPQTRDWTRATSIITWILINTIAYATLACFDAVLYLDTRIRTEGLDIAVGRSVRLGRPVDLASSVLVGSPARTRMPPRTPPPFAHGPLGPVPAPGMRPDR
jgi:hypothetical protein